MQIINQKLNNEFSDSSGTEFREITPSKSNVDTFWYWNGDNETQEMNALSEFAEVAAYKLRTRFASQFV